MFARHVVQILLTCLYWYFSVFNTLITFLFWHLFNSFVWNFQNSNLAKNLVTLTPLFQSEWLSTWRRSWRASPSLVLAGTVFAPFSTAKHHLNLKLRVVCLLGKPLCSLSYAKHYFTWKWPWYRGISGQWLDIVGYQDSRLGFWLTNCEFG